MEPNPDALDDNQPTTPRNDRSGVPVRSQFLTLLCVLTFIGCALSLFDALMTLVQTDAASNTPRIERTYTPEQQKQIPKQYFEDRSAGDESAPTDPDRIRLLAIAQFPYALLTLAGALLMFRLRRVGFWIYVAGVAIGLVLPVVLVGFGALNTSFGVFFSMLFAGLYWLNLRDMW
ncbi:hypothetical protein [Spirosoma arcticum]